MKGEGRSTDAEREGGRVLDEQTLRRLVLPFSDGVYLAVNAVPDLALVVDGLDCYVGKSERIQPNHDWQSTLHTVPDPRIFVSECGLEEQAMGNTEQVVALLRRVAAERRFRGIVLLAQSSIELTDRDYGEILEDLGPELGVPILDLTRGELSSDWLQGYASTLAQLAVGIELPPGPSDASPDAVAIVGPLMDRNEGDHLGNLAQLTGLCEGLGLEVVSIWPAGQPCSELARVAAASTILSLPHAREAARVLAQRTTARLLECPLPIGVDGCAAFLRCVGSALGRQRAAEQAIAAGESRILPLLRAPAVRWFVGRTFAFVGDPLLAEPICDLLQFLGAHPEVVVPSTLGNHEDAVSAEAAASLTGKRLLLDQVDFIVANGQFFGRSQIPVIEFGYPSYATHHLLPMPFMGYDGVLGLVERFANSLHQQASRA